MQPHVKTAFRISYLICLASGRLAARLADDYRVLARASQRWGPLVLPLQLPVLVAWWPARALSVSSFAVCAALVPKLP
jgi:hypothetical protein